MDFEIGFESFQSNTSDRLQLQTAKYEIEHMSHLEMEKVKDRIGDQRGGEWEPLKISLRNLGLCPDFTPKPSLLTRSSRLSYVKANLPRNLARNTFR